MTKRSIYRKILSKETFVTTVNQAFTVTVTQVAWIGVTSETSRTYKADRIVTVVYINGKLSLRGLSCRFIGRNKSVSISKRSPLSSKALQNIDFGDMRREAFNDAIQDYMETLTDLIGAVVYFDRRRGEGMIRIDSLDTTFPIYACNLKGKKTWYPETACVYLNEGQTVKIERLARVDRSLTPIINEGVHFDADKWNSLDQSKLPFKCDENGEAINGLFS